jgi:RNA polymerase sigma-70 factor (ECF subfamily)
MSETATGTPVSSFEAQPDLDVWVSQHGDELRRHLAGMLGTEADAEDVLQDVWITAYRNPPETGPGSNVRAWLYRVATNRALDRLARDRRRGGALSGQRFRLLPDAEPDPDAGLMRLDEKTRARIRAHLAGLPRKQRESVWLRWMEGRDYETIAARVGCSEDSARANVYNGMKRLRRELFDLWSKESEG